MARPQYGHRPWSDKRNELTGQMHELSGLAAQAVQAYRQTDLTLAQALTGASSGGPAAARRSGGSG